MVDSEWQYISDNQRRFLHSIGKLVVFGSRPWKIDQNRLNQYKSEFLIAHPKENDCQLLAEALLSGMNIILTNDKDFIKNLSCKTTVTILKPSVFLGKLRIKPGTPPVRRPEKSNPLSQKKWWQI